MKECTCCFFGHRKILETLELKKRICKCIETLIKGYGVRVFLFGSKSEFNELCYSIVTELKEIYPDIVRVYVRAEFPYISMSYRKFLLSYYEDIYYPPQIIGAGKAVYIERNREMINRSRFCVVYYDESYESDIEKLVGRPIKSGTALAFHYATKKKVTIYNMFTDNA